MLCSSQLSMWHRCSCCNRILSSLRFFSGAPRTVQLSESQLSEKKKKRIKEREREREKSLLLPSSQQSEHEILNNMWQQPHFPLRRQECCFKLSNEQSLGFPFWLIGEKLEEISYDFFFLIFFYFFFLFHVVGGFVDRNHILKTSCAVSVGGNGWLVLC